MGVSNDAIQFMQIYIFQREEGGHLQHGPNQGGPFGLFGTPMQSLSNLYQTLHPHSKKIGKTRPQNIFHVTLYSKPRHVGMHGPQFHVTSFLSNFLFPTATQFLICNKLCLFHFLRIKFFYKPDFSLIINLNYKLINIVCIILITLYVYTCQFQFKITFFLIN